MPSPPPSAGGPPLRFFYAFLLILPLLALAFITAPIVASMHRTRVETELEEYGREKTLELRTPKICSSLRLRGSA